MNPGDHPPTEGGGGVELWGVTVVVDAGTCVQECVCGVG